MYSFNGKLDVQIGVTDFCNLSCIMCQQTAHLGVYGASHESNCEMHSGNKGFMDIETMENFVNSLIEEKFVLRVLSLMWLGESTLHPEFPALLEIILKGLEKFEFAEHLVLNTNGTLFSEEIEDLILDYKKSHDSVPFTIVFSVDAASRDKFRRIKKMDLYEDVERNIKRYFLKKEKIDINTYRPLTTAVQTLVMPENQDEMPEFKNKWSQFFEENSMEYDLCHDTLHGFTHNKIYFKRVSSQKQKEVEDLHRKKIEELEIVHPFVLENERIVEFDSSLEVEESINRRPCPALFRTATINWDGTVVPCCIDSEMQLVLGNLNETSFPKIIEGEFAETLRLNHIKGEFEEYPVCRWCRNLHYPPVPDKEIIQYLQDRGHGELGDEFLERMKKAGKLRKEKNYSIIRPLEFKSLKQTLIIEVSAACNLKCVMCEQSFDPTRTNKGLMKFELFRKIIDELVETEARANVVNIFWSGESLYHPDFKKMIEYAAEKNKDYAGFGSFDIHTNGNLMSEEISDEIIRGRQFARVLISLDAGRSETYDKIRVGGDFRKVIENVKYLVKKRDELNADWPSVTLQYVVSSLNRGEIHDFINIGKEVFGEEEDAFQINYDWDKPEPFKRDVLFFKRIDELSTDDQIDSEQLHKEVCVELGLIDEVTDERIVESDEYRADEEGINPLSGEIAVRKPCVGLFTHMAIRFDGDVTACCRDIKCHLKLGNVKERSLIELFNSHLLTSMRLKHIEGRADEIKACRGCPNQICPVITKEEIIYYLKSVGRPDLILPYLKRTGEV